MVRGQTSRRRRVAADVRVEAGLREHASGTSPGFLLWHATLRWQREMAAALRETSLTHVQFVVLASAWWLNRSEAPSQRELADHAGLGQVMTSQVVRNLVRAGLLLRAREDRDARVMRVRVTPEGQALAERAVERIDAAESTFFAPVALTPELLGALRVLARRDGVGTDDGAVTDAEDGSAPS